MRHNTSKVSEQISKESHDSDNSKQITDHSLKPVKNTSLNDLITNFNTNANNLEAEYYEDRDNSYTRKATDINLISQTNQSYIQLNNNFVINTNSKNEVDEDNYIHGKYLVYDNIKKIYE